METRRCARKPLVGEIPDFIPPNPGMLKDKWIINILDKLGNAGVYREMGSHLITIPLTGEFKL